MNLNIMIDYTIDGELPNDTDVFEKIAGCIPNVILPIFEGEDWVINIDSIERIKMG